MCKFSLLYPYIIRKRVMRILRLEYQVEVFILIWHHNLVANYMEVLLLERRIIDQSLGIKGLIESETMYG